MKGVIQWMIFIRSMQNYMHTMQKSLSRPQVIAANKIDLIYDDGESENPVERLKKEFEPQGIKVFPISGVTGAGIKELLILCFY